MATATAAKSTSRSRSIRRRSTGKETTAAKYFIMETQDVAAVAVSRILPSMSQMGPSAE